MNPIRWWLYGESLTNYPRFICESRFIIILLWWIDSWFNSSFWMFFVHGDSWFNSRFESPVNRVVSRPATCHNVIAGCRRTRFLKVLKTCFSAAPATLHGDAINCVPVHRFRRWRTSETDVTLAKRTEFPRYALARILMHDVKTAAARFWRVFGWFIAHFTGFPSETPWGRFSGAHNQGFMLNGRRKKAPKGFYRVSTKLNHGLIYKK